MFESNKKAQAMGVRELFTILATAGIIALIGLLIFANVGNTINQDAFSAAQNVTAGKIKSTTLSAFELGVVGLIVLAAVVILSVVYLLGR